ncbi:MAG: hypothetical protein Q9213_000125 [Squamulea squamosa]
MTQLTKRDFTPGEVRALNRLAYGRLKTTRTQDYKSTDGSVSQITYLTGIHQQLDNKLQEDWEIPKPRYATLRTLYHPRSAVEVLDSEALILFFPAPHTVSGEDILELHVHGGNAVVKSVLGAIPLAAQSKGIKSATQDIRYAEPGEFTRRAFYNDRLDLTQVEALGDVLSAETEQQRRIAVKGSSNVLARQYESWRQQLLYARGELEALIDFSEDQHFDESPSRLVASVKKQVLGLKAQLQASIENAARGELLRNGIDIAIVGAPNAGKSSLLNCIVGREAAIVSDVAGTTRDVIDVGVDIGGFYCKFGDLAGLRNKSSDQEVTIGRIEQEGMRRAKERALFADVIVAVLSLDPPCNHNGSSMATIDVNPEVAATLRLCDPGKQAVVYVINKIDLVGPNENIPKLQDLLKKQISDNDLPLSPVPILVTSCTPDLHSRQVADGIQQLLGSLVVLFKDMTVTSVVDSVAWEVSLGATERQRLLLEQCLKDLQGFLNQADEDLGNQQLEAESIDIVLAAESLRSAANCLARITGAGEAADVEEVLGVVFENLILTTLPVDASSELITTATSRLTQRSTTHLPPTPILESRLKQAIKPRHLWGNSIATITFNSLHYRTRFSTFHALIPIKVAAAALKSIYFDVYFNLTPHGKWYKQPPRSRVLLEAGEMYLLFVASDPSVPVPWELVKIWAEVMENFIDMGGFVGFYSASFERLVGDKVVDFWVHTGVGSPIALAAAAAR